MKRKEEDEEAKKRELTNVQEEQSKLNKAVDLAYGIKGIKGPRRDIGGMISNLDNLVKAFLNYQEKIRKEEKLEEITYIFKLSGDGRQVNNGNVGYSLIPLNGIGVQSQSSSNNLPILIYNGKDNKFRIEELAGELKTYFHGCSNESSTCPETKNNGVKVKFLYTADMMNLWHTTTVKEIMIPKKKKMLYMPSERI